MRRALPPLLLAGALALAGCSGSGAQGGDTGFVSGDRLTTRLAADERAEPVSFTAPVLGDGDQLALSELRGEVVVLNVWGSWCSPCRQEAPDLVAAAEELEGEATFLGVNVRDNDAAALRFEERFGVTYPSVVDRDGGVLLALRGAVAPNAIPSTVVVDREGRVAARVSGRVDRATLVGLVEDVLAEDSPAAG